MLNNLKTYMISKSITVIEHNDLFIGNAIVINKSDLEIFRYQTENNILHHNMKIEVPGVYWFLSYKYIVSLHLLFYLIDSPKLCLHPLAPILLLLWNYQLYSASNKILQFIIYKTMTNFVGNWENNKNILFGTKNNRN